MHVTILYIEVLMRKVDLPQFNFLSPNISIELCKKKQEIYIDFFYIVSISYTEILTIRNSIYGALSQVKRVKKLLNLGRVVSI